MKIAVLGTGTVGRTLAARFADLGHDVAVGTRDAAATLSRDEADAMGNPPFSTWAGEHPQVALVEFADLAADTDVVVNATNGAGSLDALARVDAEVLDGMVLLDVSNPLDFSRGMPPTLFVKDDDSLGERIQRAFPRARVVKSLNTMTAALMADPAALAEGDHSVLVSGNDAEAKKAVTSLLESLGHTDVVDLGDITTARGAEMWLPLWLRLWGALGTPMFNLKIVR